jgi:hypothetical protein
MSDKIIEDIARAYVFLENAYRAVEIGKEFEIWNALNATWIAALSVASESEFDDAIEQVKAREAK